MAEEYDMFAKALAAAKARPDTNAWISFDGDTSIDESARMRPEYRFPASLLHADWDLPQGTVMFVNTSVGYKLSGRSTPTNAVQTNIVGYYNRGVMLRVDEATKVDADKHTWVRVTEVEGTAILATIWVAWDLLSAERPQ